MKDPWPDLIKFTHSRRIETVVSQPRALWHGWTGVCVCGRKDAEVDLEGHMELRR